MPERMIPDMSRDEKEQLKLERLQSTLNRACKNVPFHRSRFLAIGISPQDIVLPGRPHPPAIHGYRPPGQPTTPTVFLPSP